jgi:cholesterol transport system auxiliary component
MTHAARPRGTASLLLCLAIVLPGLLAGCGGLLPKAPERPLYRLNPTVAFSGASQPAPRRIPALLVIATPSASAGLDTKRIALINSPVAIDYFAEGEWIDRPPFLVKEALIEGFQKSGAFAGVTSEGLGLNADYLLNTDIRDFTAIYDTPGDPPLVRVRIAAELITMPGRNIAASTSVTREARAGAPDLPAVVSAFDRALGEAVQEIIAWSASHAALAAKRK